MKAQANTVFVFIMAVIIMGVIALLGYQMITKIIAGSEETLKIQFLRTITEDVQDISRLKGTSEEKSYKLPSAISKVCVVNSSCTYDGNCVIDDSGILPLDNYKDNIPEINMFLIEGNSIKETVPLGKVEMSKDFIDANQNTGGFCANTKASKITLVIEGTGDGVKISQ